MEQSLTTVEKTEEYSTRYTVVITVHLTCFRLDIQ